MISKAYCSGSHGTLPAPMLFPLAQPEMKEITLTRSDRKRFDALMERSYKKVFNLAYRLSGNRSDAEDLTQEAFFRAYRAFHTFQGDRPFENWIFRIVTRLFLDLRRRRTRRVRTLSYDNPLRPDGAEDTVQFEKADESNSPERAFFQDIYSEELEESLKMLSDDQRELVQMADIDQLPYATIAEKLGAPVGTIRSRLHRAHKKLRALLEAVRTSKPEPCHGC